MGFLAKMKLDSDSKDQYVHVASLPTYEIYLFI